MELSPNLNWVLHHCLHIGPFQNVCLGDVNGAYFMCLKSLSIYSDHWKSFIKFRIKKSHEMISHVIVSNVFTMCLDGTIK
jgi:hypothetical protein